MSVLFLGAVVGGSHRPILMAVMAGLVPAIHVRSGLASRRATDMKMPGAMAGHDEKLNTC